MRNFVIILLLGTAIGFGCAKALDQPAVAAESPLVIDDLIKPGVRFGTAHMQVEEGTDLEAFENYLMTGWLPRWRKAYELTGTGVEAYVTKVVYEGEGQYGWITLFPKNETHSLLFTPEGEMKELLRNAVEEADVQFQPDFPGYIEWKHQGDVVLLESE